MLCCTLHVVDRSASHRGKAACRPQSGECCVLYFACGALYGACCDAACCALRAALRGPALGLAPLQLALDVRPRPAAHVRAHSGHHRRTLDVTAMRCARRAHDRPQRPNGRSSPVPQRGGRWLVKCGTKGAGCSTTDRFSQVSSCCRAARERQRAAWVCGDACSAQVCFARRSAILHT